MVINAFNIEEDERLKLLTKKKDEAFNRFIEISPKKCEKIMKEVPHKENTILSLSLTLYTTNNKRVCHSEEDSIPTLVGGILLKPELQQINLIRQIREVKSQ